MAKRILIYCHTSCSFVYNRPISTHVSKDDLATCQL